jgi:ABC-2 type transport system permease protein
MSAQRKLITSEAKLFLREPMSVAFGVLFPTVLLLALGAIPALREPSPEFGNARFVDLWAPTSVVLGLGIVGLQHIPAVVSRYREDGILRRMSTTPVHPAAVLVAQLIVAMAAVVVSAVLVILTAWLVFDLPLPQHPVRFTVAFVVGFGAMLAIGMLIAAVSPNTRAANGFSTIAYMLTMFAGGVFLPRFLLPDFLVELGSYTPPGIQALTDAWSGGPEIAVALGVETTGPQQAIQLAIMVLVALVAGGAAAKLFRWE